MSSAETSVIPGKVIKYEAFLNETLKKDLKNVLEQRDKVYNKLSEYLQLKNVIQNMQETCTDGKPLKTQVDLGSNFYIQAKVDDPTMIFVSIGFGFFLEMTLAEAIKFIEEKVTILNGESELMTKQVCEIKARIKLVIEGLREIQNIEDGQSDKPQRDIFS